MRWWSKTNRKSTATAAKLIHFPGLIIILSIGVAEEIVTNELYLKSEIIHKI